MTLSLRLEGMLICSETEIETKKLQYEVSYLTVYSFDSLIVEALSHTLTFYTDTQPLMQGLSEYKEPKHSVSALSSRCQELNGT